MLERVNDMTKKKSSPSAETQRQKAYSDRVVSEGGRRLQMLLQADEAQRWAAIVARHGGAKPALVAMMDAVEARANGLTDAELVAQIKARLGVGQ
jgi:predicted kinase